MLNILGMGYAHPNIVLDNSFIESLGIDTTNEWIIEKIGVRTRRTTLPLNYIAETRNQEPKLAREVSTMTATELGVEASKMALERARIEPEKIGLIICNCCTPCQTAPAESQRIAGVLGLKIPAYDVFSACPAFALHIDFLSSFKEEKVPEYVLCVSTATLTHNVDYNDRTDGAIWGDGAGAWVVSTRHDGKLRVLDSCFMADPVRNQAVTIDRYTHFRQDGRAVRDFSVRQTVRLIKQLDEKYGLNWSKDVFVGHQANATMLAQIVKNRGIPEASHWHNVEEYGNQAGASAPIVIAMNWDKIRPNMKIVVAVVGAGLSWGSVLLEGI